MYEVLQPILKTGLLLESRVYAPSGKQPNPSSFRGIFSRGARGRLGPMGQPLTAL